MNIDPINKLMFFHIPKCAGASLLTAFNIKKNEMVNRTIVSGLTTAEIISHQPEHIKEWFSTFIKFTIIRNPYDRLVSLYHFRKKQKDLYNLYSGANTSGGDETTPEGTELSFKEWVMDSRSRGVGKLWDSDPYIGFDKSREIYLWKNHPANYDLMQEWINQVHFITDINGKQMVSDILRFENLDKEVENFCKKYDLKNIKLPKKNTSPRKKNYVDYYDDELIEFSTRLFEDDLKYFNYKFGD